MLKCSTGKEDGWKKLPGLPWTVPAHVPAMSVAKILIYTEVPAPTAHLCCAICPHGARHIPSTCQSSMESSSQPPLRMKGLNSASLSWTLINYFYQTTLLAQHRAATAQKQEGNALPYLFLMSSCPVKHKKHKGCIRESSRLMWLRKDFMPGTSSIKDTSRV